MMFRFVWYQVNVFNDCMMWRFAADNPSTLSCIICRAGPMAWKPRSALSEGFLLALWPGSIRIRSAGGIFGFPRLVYSPRYSRGRQQGCRLPSAYLGYTLRMKTLFRDWPVMVHDTRTRRRRRLFSVCHDGLCIKELTMSAQITEVNFDVTSL